MTLTTSSHFPGREILAEAKMMKGYLGRVCPRWEPRAKKTRKPGKVWKER